MHRETARAPGTNLQLWETSCVRRKINVCAVCSGIRVLDLLVLFRTRKKGNHKDATGCSIVTLSGPCDVLSCDWTFSWRRVSLSFSVGVERNLLRRRYPRCLQSKQSWGKGHWTERTMLPTLGTAGWNRSRLRRFVAWRGRVLFEIVRGPLSQVIKCWKTSWIAKRWRMLNVRWRKFMMGGEHHSVDARPYGTGGVKNLQNKKTNSSRIKRNRKVVWGRYISLWSW